MKTIHKFIMTRKLLLTLMLFAPFALIADGDEQTAPPINPDIPETEEPIPIPIAPGPITGNKPLRPRTPDCGADISAYYQNGVIYLQFIEDIGCMDVDVVNLTSGELWSDDACSDSQMETVIVSSATGNYTITLTTDNGTVYSGEYTIE